MSELELAYRDSVPFTHDMYPESLGIPVAQTEYDPRLNLGPIDFGRRFYSTFPDSWIPEGIKVAEGLAYRDEEFDRLVTVRVRKLPLVRTQDYQKNNLELPEDLRRAIIRGALNILKRNHASHVYSLREMRVSVYGMMERKTSWSARCATLFMPNDHDPYRPLNRKFGPDGG